MFITVKHTRIIEPTEGHFTTKDTKKNPLPFKGRAGVGMGLYNNRMGLYNVGFFVGNGHDRSLHVWTDDEPEENIFQRENIARQVR